jgi:hypothetical protein
MSDARDCQRLYRSVASRTMFESGLAEEFSVALVNAALLALWPVLPGLLFAYIHQSLAARRIRPEFSLRKSEMAELDRATALYQDVCRRLEEIDDRDAGRPTSHWTARFRRGADIPEAEAEERDDLEAHAQHLRATIVRLRGWPLRRLRSWVRTKTWQFALGRALAAHVAGLGLLIAALHLPEQAAWADELTPGSGQLRVWYPLDERLFYANAAAAGFAAITALIFYLVRWSGLCREYGVEFCTFKELAYTDPSQPAAQAQADGDAAQPEADANALSAGGDWPAVLGVAPSATADEVKEAYKRLIKQNHPDRVHGMSPAFRKLAEAETKKLNAAYRQAVVLFASPAIGQNAA